MPKNKSTVQDAPVPAPQIEFEDISAVADDLLQYAVIVSRYHGQWVYCKHRARDTWEIPGGRREPGEPILTTAKRELFEETGALAYDLTPVCVYAVGGGVKSHGLLCYTDIHSLGPLPASEIECIQFFAEEPEALTYPHIQPFLLAQIKKWLVERPL